VTLSIVIPVKNEEKSIGNVIKSIIKNTKDIKSEIIVVNSSSDRSGHIAKKLGAIVLNEHRQGYGVAIRKGIEKSKYNNILFIDGDGSYSPKEIPKIFNEFLEQNADITLASRFKGGLERGSMPLINFAGNKLLTFLINLFFKADVSDSQSGLRLFKKKSIKRLKLNSNGMEFASEMVIKAKKKKLKIAEVPIVYKKRIGKRKLKVLRDGLRHLILIFHELF